VVDDQVIESDGKTENAQHLLALDPFTLAVLKSHVGQLDAERAYFGPDYQDHGWLFCWENGKPPHPDTIPAVSRSSPGRPGCLTSIYTTSGTAALPLAATRKSTGRHSLAVSGTRTSRSP
jgi:hypothetical protein